MMKQWKKTLVLGVSVMTAAMVLAGCGGGEQPKSATGAPQQKVLKIGTNATFVPFEFKNDKTGQHDGFDIDMINAIAKKMNAKPEFKDVSFDALIPALFSNDIDIAVSGMSITAARAEKVLFSAPYYEAGLGLIVKADSGISSFDDLNGKSVAAQMGTTGADLAEKLPGVTAKQFDHTNEALLELGNNGVDGAIIDLPVAEYYVAQHKDAGFKVIPYASETKEYFGMAINKSNTALKEEVDKAIAAMKADGEFNKIYRKWFDKDMPKDMPAK